MIAVITSEKLPIKLWLEENVMEECTKRGHAENAKIR